MKDREIGSLLFLTDKSYARIMGHLRRKEMENEAVEREIAYKRHLKERSAAMAEKWPDSIQNIKQREQERREMKEQLLEQMRNEQSEYYKEFHRQERKKYLADIREKMKMKRQPTSFLSNALLESHIRAENAANIKLRKEIKREEDEKEARWVEFIHKDVEEYRLKEEEKKCRAREKSKRLQAFQLKQIEDKLKNDQEEKNNRLIEERDDLKKSKDEIEERRYNELEDFRNRKKGMRKYMHSQHRKKEREKNILKTEDAELTEVCNIYNEFNIKRRCRIDQQKKQELMDANEARQKLGLSNKQVDDNKEEKQNEILAKQHMEQEEKYQREEEQAAKRRDQMQKEMDEFYSHSISRKKQRENEMAEVLRYKMAERIKDMEEIIKYDDMKKKRIRNSEIEFTKEWGKQIEEKKEFESKKNPQKIVRDIHEIEDEKFFLYSKDVLEHARKKGLEDQPITREINEYCKKNRLPPYPECLNMVESSPPTFQKSAVKLPKI